MSSDEDLISKLLRPKNEEPDHELDRLAHSVIGAAIEVHRQLGPGVLEGVYETALCIEFGLRKIPFKQQHRVGIV